jgi:tetrapyrrole methylase family protein/MazG family protein
LENPLKPAFPTSFEGIEALITKLRGENGCPWDKKQTPETMTRYLIEEVYELVDAILANDPDAVCEEAGDVLFLLLFVVHLFFEAGHFNTRDVIRKNLQKMVRRHPHVFGTTEVKNSEAVIENWDRIKREEKKSNENASILSSIPKNIPALLRAAMVSEKAAKTGFDWDDIAAVMAKTMEEWGEFSKEVEASGGKRDEKAAMEFGDVLFTMVNVARFARIHPEEALLRSVYKFEKRFGYLEEKATAAGRCIDDLTFEEMHELWDEAKTRIS